MKKVLRYISVGAVVLLVGGLVIADTVNQEFHLLVDGDMETAGVADWGAGGSATLTKETGAVNDGTQVLRNAYNGVANPYAAQTLLTVGEKYRATGWARGDGTAVPRFSDSGLFTWTGTSSTEWQYFDVVFTAAGTNIRLYAITTGASYAEFDDIMVTEYTPPIVNNEETISGWDDGDMETAGVADWVADNSSVLTKETTNPRDGTQVMRITYGGTNSPAAYQAVGSVGVTYRATGWARGDGTGVPVFKAYSTVWTGTNSASWQYFDITYTQDTNNRIVLGAVLSVAGYVEFDDIFVTEYTPPMVNDNSQVLAGGDMEEAGVASWAANNNATLTKSTGWVDDGSQVLRVAYLDTSAPGAKQTILTIGKTYRIKGWGRGDGTWVPRVTVVGAPEWTGTSSTSWQKFDFVYTADGGGIFFNADATGAGYVEFDDIFVTETEPQYNHYGQLLVDGDMEAADTSAWTGHGTGVLSKESADPQSGSNALRVTGDPGDGAKQAALTSGIEYRATGWARGDGGTGVPSVNQGGSGSAVWTGTNSTTWQAFDVTYTSDAANFLIRTTGGGYVEFDGVVVTRTD